VKERAMTRPKEFFSSYSSDYNYDPHMDDGDFLPSEYYNPVRKNGVKSAGRPQHYNHATFHKDVVTMQDGTRYNVTSTEIPEKFRQPGSDIVNIETSAWTTKADGLNRDRMHELARLAIPTVFISVQQNLTRFGHIAQNAHNQIEIAKTLAPQYGYSTEHAISTGISRGGMTSLVVGSVAKQHDMEIAYIDSLVPVRPNGIDFQYDIKHLIDSLPNEGKALASLREIPFKKLWHYSSTLDTTLRGIWQQLKEVPTLLSGEVGRQIDSNMQEDQFGVITAFNGDLFTQGDVWNERFDGIRYPNMVVNSREGGAHMTCALDESFDGWHGRVRTVSEIFHERTSNRELGGAALRAMSAVENSAFLQAHEIDSELAHYQRLKNL
jgi:hypothetical protein